MSGHRTAEATAFDDWVRARLPHLARFARTLTADEHAAHDLVQDALERALLHWHRIEDPDAWVRRAMVNRSISVWRKLSRERPTDAMPDETVDHAVDDAVRDVVLMDALKTLAPRQRAVIALRYFEDLTEAQTAAILGCSVGTVKSQASAAIRNLRGRIGEVYVDTPAVLEEVHAGADARRRRRGLAAIAAVATALVVVAGGTAWVTRPGHGGLRVPATTYSVRPPSDTPSHLDPASGPGLRITLSDAPRSVIASSSLDPHLMLVHTKDVEAVVAALWRGGATAVSFRGRRLIPTSRIVMPSPTAHTALVLQAIGDPARLTAAIDQDAYVKLYRQQAADPDIAVGWRMTRSSRIAVPAYDGQP